MSFFESTKTLASEVRDLKIIRFFRYADLRCGHEGLAEYAKEKGYDVSILKPGEFLVFINTQETKMKILTVQGLLVYLKNPENRKFDLSIVRYIPKYFKGGSINYQNALTEMIMKKVEK